jgi:protein-L-isoaspartate(D-aspartate) O-methyltransferase
MRRRILAALVLVTCAVTMDDTTTEARKRMVDEQVAGRDVTDESVLSAMRRVPRHKFVDAGAQRLAYSDQPIPIGHGATISQPYVVAKMTELARVRPGDRVLDVGTGSGYQAAVLAEMGAEVYGIEIVPELAERAAAVLAELGYRAEVRAGDGYAGWPEHAPFHAIIVAAAAPTLPKPLVDQLAPGGRLVIPMGVGIQELMVIEKDPRGGVRTETILPVRFVPMTGEVERITYN